MTFSTTTRTFGTLSRAQVISEAHKVLLALSQGSSLSLQEASTAALNWLEERGLIESLLGEGDLEYEVTPRGQQAVLGGASH